MLRFGGVCEGRSLIEAFREIPVTKNALVAALAAFSCAAPASAHHSFAMFDRSRIVSVTGTVKEFEMINPHGWLQLMVVNSQGRANEWSLETGGPGQLVRAGWQKESVRPGDKVTVEIHPLKDGSNGGELMSVILPNGQTLGTGGPPSPNRGAPKGADGE